MGKMLIGLGGICLHRGDFPQEALPYLEQAEMHYAYHGMCIDNDDTKGEQQQQQQQQQPPDPHPEISVVFNNQALIYRMMGQHHVGIEKYKKMLVFCEKYESDNEEKRDHIQLQIADCLFSVNQLSPSLDYFQTLLQNELTRQERRRHGGEENSASTSQEGMLRYHIGVIHSKQVCTDTYTHTHSLVAPLSIFSQYTLLVVAVLFVYNQGHMEDALRELESACVIQKATLGEMHQDVASTLNALGAVHATIGNDGEALSYFQESLMIARVHAGPNEREDPQVMQTLRNISLVHGDKVPKWN
jgi:tetratricopeptide (TPR) repeat protein